MRIESVDIRHGDDAAFYLLVRTGLRSAADVATLGVLDLAAIALTIAAVRMLAGFGLVPPNPPGAPMTPLFAYAVLCGLAGLGAYRAGDQRRSALRIAGAVTMSGIALSATATFAGWGVAWEYMAALTGGVVVAVLETRLLGERLTRFVR
ncbi:MAG: hypothetical protein GWN71_34395, partial [Gammaproteobacteria bacterium]|nr:hypothetical protein [Gemmatimonadota bacterium]NIU78467.1 hypothetical protein [Gammaproteobacteria bacterium]